MNVDSKQLLMLLTSASLLVGLFCLIRLAGPDCRRLKQLSSSRGRLHENVGKKNRTLEGVIPLLFPVKPLVFWNTDYHATPISDLADFLRPFGVRVLDKNFDWSRCAIFGNCAGRSTLRVIKHDNALGVDDPALVGRFQAEYRDDEEMKSVDAFVCFHPAAICELYVPFNKSIVVIATTRYNLARFESDRWTHWNEVLTGIAAGPANVVAANNLYDAEYIRHFTGIDARVLPSNCGYVFNLTYNQTRPGYLLGNTRNRVILEYFKSEFSRSCADLATTSSSCPPALLVGVYDKYPFPNLQFSDIIAHAGIVHLPYQVSVMSLFEQYRMNVPLFCPSERLLFEWQLRFEAMNERAARPALLGWPLDPTAPRPNGSVIAAHPSQRGVPDPNDEIHPAAIRHWIQFADYLQWPHITRFDTVDELVRLLMTLTPADLRRISDRMRTHNAQVRAELVDEWRNILVKIARHSSNQPH